MTEICTPSETVSEGIDPISLQRHETAESLLRQFWSFAVLDIFEDADLPCLGGELRDEDGPGADDMASPNDMLAGITEAGFWAFADVPNRIVHVWSGPGCSKADMVALLAHEVGHCVGVKDEDEEKEEARAHTYGFAAMMAVQWAGIF